MVVLYGLQHHETTQAFIRALEFLAPSVQSVQAMRAHIVFTSFERRWQLPVYFQLRWKEIVAKLEDALATADVRSIVSDAPLRVLDEVVAAAGTWDGCIRSRTLRPLLPSFAPPGSTPRSS